MNIEVKKQYFKPEVKVLRLHLERTLLGISGDGVKLQGAGVDESNADDNGTNIW